MRSPLAQRLDSQVTTPPPSTMMETPGAMVGKPFKISTAGEFVKGINVDVVVDVGAGTPPPALLS